MAGLLSGEYLPDPLSQGLLGLGSALLTPRQMGGGLAAGAQAFNQGAQQAALLRRQMQADAELQQMMRERADMERQKFGFEKQQYETGLAEQQRQQQVMAQVRSQIEQANPALLPLFDTNPQAAMERLFPKPQEAYTLAPGAVRMGADNKPLAENPRAANPPPATNVARLTAERDALPPGDPRRKLYDDALRKETQFAPSPVTNVTINQGQKGFDNERSLRTEFQGSATTKAFGEVQSAYDIIKGALANPSGANDLAAATKFMKLLDPGSVVRESELGMAMAATGLADRMQNYVQMMASGQKLTPKQREDFGKAADQIFGAARKRYSETAQNMRGQAAKWELDPNAVAPPAWKIYGYKNRDEAVQDARNAVMKNPQAKGEIVRRLVEELGITDHGIK